MCQRKISTTVFPEGSTSVFGFYWIQWLFWTTVSSDFSWFLCLHLLFPSSSPALFFCKAFALWSSVTVTEGKTERVTSDEEMVFQWDGSAVPLHLGAWKHHFSSLKRAKIPKSLLDDRHYFLSLFSLLHSHLLSPLHSSKSKRTWSVHILQWVLLTRTKL